MSDVIVSDVIVSDVIGSDIIVSDGVFCRPKDPGIEIEDISSWGLATNSWQVLMMAQHQIKKPSLPKIKDHTHNYLFTDEDDTSRMWGQHFATLDADLSVNVTIIFNHNSAMTPRHRIDVWFVIQYCYFYSRCSLCCIPLRNKHHRDQICLSLSSNLSLAPTGALYMMLLYIQQAATFWDLSIHAFLYNLFLSIGSQEFLQSLSLPLLLLVPLGPILTWAISAQ